MNAVGNNYIEGSIVEVDLEFPKKSHNLRNDCSPVSKNIVIKDVCYQVIAKININAIIQLVESKCLYLV